MSPTHPSVVDVHRPVFPPVRLAEPDGLLAVGGDLSVERLLLAYRSEIFPWYEAGTWITGEMLDAYCRLHAEGYAHSVEVWQGEELAGGLYGVSLGRCFFGESMFTRVSNASKFALIFLVGRLLPLGFSLIDCQVPTEHLRRLGAEEIPRSGFLRRLKAALRHPALRGNWSDGAASLAQPARAGAHV